MRWRRRVFVEMSAVAATVALAACGALASCGGGSVATAPAGGLTLAYAGNLDGEIEPCG